jgi:nicotinamidase-related amidase
MKQFRADSAVVVIDMQNGFLERESPLCIQGAKETVPACSRVIRQAHREQVPVFFVNRRYRADGSDVELVRKERWEQGGRPLSELACGPLSAENPPELGGGPQDYMLVKPRFSAFFHTELDLLLRRKQIKTVYLLGTTTPNCIRTTCYDGLSLDYEVVIVADCCSSNTEEIQQANLRDMENIGAEIVQSGDLSEE